MPFTFNGIGTTYYGRRDGGPDGSYVTTEWWVFAWIPVFPIGSYRVLPTTEATNILVYNSRGYVAREVPLCWRQIRNTYIVVGGIVLAVFAVIAVSR